MFQNLMRLMIFAIDKLIISYLSSVIPFTFWPQKRIEHYYTKEFVLKDFAKWVSSNFVLT